MVTYWRSEDLLNVGNRAGQCGDWQALKALFAVGVLNAMLL
jgi:hypothetical protein